ncbi:DEAD/DEAH box helicase [Atopobacter phocae]|uniref:DEAD/DEAH box helicase n=1 Tax=Atopobacter phocae TaxID=136492 RepID=UPI00046EC3BE|nr:helicase-related protein [Atopobacter phocae]
MSKEASLFEQQLIGRQLALKELDDTIPQHVDEKELIEIIETIPALNDSHCQRCGSPSNQWIVKPCFACDTTCYYCVSCLNFSRLSSCTKLYRLTKERTQFLLQEMWRNYLSFSYELAFELSSEQQRVSSDIEQAIVEKKELLVWAVTGAGKTEMTFKGIQTALNQHQMVCYAAPRVDVTIDLKPRYEAAFHPLTIPIFYGNSEEKSGIAPLMMMTTHQLLRFYHLFDVIIIDEGDAFPSVNNSMLQHAVQQALRPDGVIIWLTATPPQSLMKRVEQGQCQLSILPARYHGHPLVVPTFKWVGNWAKMLDKKSCPLALKLLIKRYLERNIPFLIYLPHIERMLQLEEILKREFKTNHFTSVSSKDELRQEKVQRMREGEWDFLLTTTILERGVTFKGINVIILGSEHHTFSSEILIQIAGRVGRSVDQPTGEVIFLHHGQSQAMKIARKQIKHLNQLAKKQK